jgi:hypothetical protein
MRPLRLLAAVALGAVVLALLAVPGSATTAPAGPTGVRAEASRTFEAQTDIGQESTARVAGCVGVTVLTMGPGLHTAFVTNGCRTTQRVKVIWAFAPDSSCFVLRPGGAASSTRPRTSQFDGLRSC